MVMFWLNVGLIKNLSMLRYYRAPFQILFNSSSQEMVGIIGCLEAHFPIKLYIIFGSK